MYKILECDGTEITKFDGAILNRLATAGMSGIVSGILNECAVTATGNTISIDSGMLMINGFRVVNDESVTFSFAIPPAKQTYYRIIAQIERTAADDVKFSIFTAGNRAIQTDDILNGYGIFQVNIADFELSTSGQILNIINQAEKIDGGGNGNVYINSVKTNAIAANQEPNVSITKSFDNYRKKHSLNFVFDIPKGKDGINGKDGVNGARGEKGAPGSTPQIGVNGNWYIDNIDTGISATGIKSSDIVDNLSTDDSTKPLSARQGMALKTLAEEKIAKTDIVGAIDGDDHSYGKVPSLGAVNAFKRDYDDRVSSVNLALAQKANAADVYTKAQVDAKIAEGGSGSGGGSVAPAKIDLLPAPVWEDAIFSYGLRQTPGGEQIESWNFKIPIKLPNGTTAIENGVPITFVLKYGDENSGYRRVRVQAVTENMAFVPLAVTDTPTGVVTDSIDGVYGVGEIYVSPVYSAVQNYEDSFLTPWNTSSGTWYKAISQTRAAYTFISNHLQMVYMDADKVVPFLERNKGKYLFGEEITDAYIAGLAAQMTAELLLTKEVLTSEKPDYPYVVLDGHTAPVYPSYTIVMQIEQTKVSTATGTTETWLAKTINSKMRFEHIYLEI